LIAAVEEMIKLKGRLASARTDNERTALQRQIDATDRQIDQLVYQLYGLTDREIALIEN
jgi:hypothetical protein